MIDHRSRIYIISYDDVDVDIGVIMIKSITPLSSPSLRQYDWSERKRTRMDTAMEPDHHDPDAQSSICIGKELITPGDLNARPTISRRCHGTA